MLLGKQSRDLFGFTLGVRIEDALMITEPIASYHFEFSIPVWFISLDLHKAFGRADHNALFEALRHYGLRDGYIAIFQQLYANQRGFANRSDAFQTERGLK